MKVLLPILLAFLVSTHILAQGAERIRSLETKITEATVYLKGAQVLREGGLNLEKGEQTLILKSLSELLDPNSITVKGKGEVKILSVQHQFDFLEEQSSLKAIDSLDILVEKAEVDIRNQNNRITVLKEKEALIQANRKLGTENITSIQVLQMLTLYEKELTSIQEEKSALAVGIRNSRSHLNKLRQQIAEIR